MKHKDKVLELFLRWKKLVEPRLGRKIKTSQSNNGGEYTSDLFKKVY